MTTCEECGAELEPGRSCAACEPDSADAPRVGRVVLPVVEGGQVVYRDCAIEVPTGYALRGGFLVWEPEPDTAPPDEPVAPRRPRIAWADGDRVIVGEPALEVWHGTGADPNFPCEVELIRDHRPELRVPARWRDLLGDVAFEMYRYPSWSAESDQREFLGRWTSYDIPSTAPIGGAASSPRIRVSIPGVGTFAATYTGRQERGAPCYIVDPIELARGRRAG